MNDLFVLCLKVDAVVCNKAYMVKFVVVEVSLYVWKDNFKGKSLFLTWKGHWRMNFILKVAVTPNEKRDRVRLCENWGLCRLWLCVFIVHRCEIFFLLMISFSSKQNELLVWMELCLFFFKRIVTYLNLVFLVIVCGDSNRCAFLM